MYSNTQFFGYELKKSKSVENDQKRRSSFAIPETNDGALNLEINDGGLGFFSDSYVDIDGIMRTEQDLIQKYRDITHIPEVDDAVEQIINEAIVTDEEELPVTVNLDGVDKTLLPENVKKVVAEEFEYLVKLMGLRTKGHDIFRNWYVDGKMYYHKIIDDKAPKKGIRELRPLDPTRTKKVREIKKRKDLETGVDVIEEMKEYYIYLPEYASSVHQGIPIAVDTISYCPSGIVSDDKKMTLGYLYKALRPANQLKMMEDALVIYRIARAPERRVFYIDVGSLPKTKAEQYIESMMRRHKNKLVYEASTGEVRNDRNHMSMLEDYWLPRREGTNTTEIETLGGGQNLGDIEDILFFQRKLLKSMNVPISRLESENGFNLGRASEITRDELKFNKFIQRLRSRFSELFYDILGTHIILKGIMKKEDWEAIKKDVYFDFLRDSHFSEMKELELLSERFEIVSRIENYIGRFISEDKVKRVILQQDDEEIKEEQKQMDKEKPAEDDDNDDVGGGFGRGGNRGRY